MPDCPCLMVWDFITLLKTMCSFKLMNCLLMRFPFNISRSQLTTANKGWLHLWKVKPWIRGDHCASILGLGDYFLQRALQWHYLISVSIVIPQENWSYLFLGSVAYQGYTTWSMGMVLWLSLSPSARWSQTSLSHTCSFPTGQVQTSVSGSLPGVVSYVAFLFQSSN